MARTTQSPTAMDDPLTKSWPVVAAKRYDDGGEAPPSAPVTHSYAALAFYVGGRAEMELWGKPWHLREGDALLLPAGAPHRRLTVQGAELWGLAINVPCFASNDDTTLMGSFEQVRDGSSPVIPIPVDRHELLVTLFHEARQAHRASHAGDNLESVQRSLLTLILAEVAKASSMSGTHTTVGGGVVVESLRFIERNRHRKVTLRDVATAVGRSPAYVTTALKRGTGRGATQWIISGKMAEARRLLLRSDEMVDIVAERVGYADATHFIRMFRREHGLTPAAWRTAQMHQTLRSSFPPTTPQSVGD